MFKELERRAREVMPNPARDEYDEVRMTVNASDVLELIELAKLARTVARIMSDQGDISPTAMKLYDALRAIEM